MRLGNMPGGDRKIYQQPRNTSNLIPNNRLNNTRHRTGINDFNPTSQKDFRMPDNDKSKSFDSEYDKYQYNIKTEFDKSRSFDDDYGTQKPIKSVNESRSFSNERVCSKVSNVKSSTNGGGASQAQPPAQKQSPQSYGSRLYEHEMMYDLARKAMDRSPIMEFRRQQQIQRNHNASGGRNSRERSPNKASSNEQQQLYRPFNRNTDQSLNRRDLSPNDTLSVMPTVNYLTNNSSPSSEFDVQYEIGSDMMDDELIREAELVTEFLYGNKARAEAYLNQRRKDNKNITQMAGTPSSGRYIRN